MTLLIGFILSIFFAIDVDFIAGILVRACKRLAGHSENDGRREHMAAGLITTVAVLLSGTAATVLILSGLELVSSVAGFVGETLIFCMVLDTAKIRKCAKDAYLSQKSDSDSIKEACMAIADGLCDGIIAPVFYMAIGGAWLAVFYRIARGVYAELENEKSVGLSKFPTRLYDILDFVPCRLAAVLAMCACRLIGCDYKNAIEIFWRDRMKCGYNKGQVRAVFAGALGVRFGRAEHNFNDYMNEPSIGEDTKDAEKNDIKIAMKLVYLAAAIAVISGSIVRFIFT